MFYNTNCSQTVKQPLISIRKCKVTIQMKVVSAWDDPQEKDIAAIYRETKA